MYIYISFSVVGIPLFLLWSQKYILQLTTKIEFLLTHFCYNAPFIKSSYRYVSCRTNIILCTISKVNYVLLDLSLRRNIPHKRTEIFVPYIRHYYLFEICCISWSYILSLLNYYFHNILFISLLDWIFFESHLDTLKLHHNCCPQLSKGSDGSDV
jgi:hypothetical protein